MKMIPAKRRRIRWDRVAGAITIILMILAGLDIAISKPEIKNTPVGNYECKGHILKVCSGSNEVANYLGVE